MSNNKPKVVPKLLVVVGDHHTKEADQKYSIPLSFHATKGDRDLENIEIDVYLPDGGRISLKTDKKGKVSHNYEIPFKESSQKIVLKCRNPKFGLEEDIELHVPGVPPKSDGKEGEKPKPARITIENVYRDNNTGNTHIMVHVVGKSGKSVEGKTCVLLIRDKMIEDKKTSANGYVHFVIEKADGPQSPHDGVVEAIITVDDIDGRVSEELYLPPVINTANNWWALSFLLSMPITWFISLLLFGLNGITTSSGIVFLSASVWTLFSLIFPVFALRQEVLYALKVAYHEVRKPFLRTQRDPVIEQMIEFFEKHHKEKEGEVTHVVPPVVHQGDTFGQRVAADMTSETLFHAIKLFLERLFRNVKLK